MDITALLSEERADEPRGLWATKQYGDFKEGDRLRATDYVTGSVEVRQLRSVFKLSFLDITLVNRLKPADNETVTEVELDTEETCDGSSISSSQKRDARNKTAMRLHVYLTKKKAKIRMADLEETGFLLLLDVGEEGCICLGKTFGDFDQSLMHIADPTGFKGIVIAKRKIDAPATEEPVVYAYAKFVQHRRPVMATEVVLGLAQDKDRVTRYTKTAQTVKTDEELVKGVPKYTRTARKAWETLSIPEDQEIDFEGFKKAFDELNQVVVESRALRLFKICDLNGSGTIGISELEVALMIHDAVPTTPHLSSRDWFEVFDLDGGGEISWLAFKEAADVITGGKITESKLEELFDKVDGDKSGTIEYGKFKEAWLELVDLDQELKARGIRPAFGPMARVRNKRFLLKAVEEEDQLTEETFQTALMRVDNVQKKARLLRDERKKRNAARAGKTTLADASQDATKRRQRRLMLKREQAERSRQRFEHKIKQNELQQQIAAKKERDSSLMKQRMAQQEKDRIAGIRARGDDQLCLSHFSLREIPEKHYRDRDGRDRSVDLVLLDLQDNRLTHLPDDFLSNMVSLRKLVVSKNRLTSLVDEHWSSLTQLQVLDLSRNQLRELPPSIGKLASVQHLNITKNEIHHLPDKINGMRALRSLRAHSNNLKNLPVSFGGLVSLELCDLSRNRLETLPNDFSYATALTRLDLSGNRLWGLPLDFGNLFSLQVLDVSCNQLVELPSSISNLKNLQVVKVGENRMVEMDEAWGGMTSLVDVEALANSIVRVSSEIGSLKRLQRLDLCRNSIEELPPEIGLLTMLHDINLRSNRLSRLPDEIGALVRLNRLSVAYNCLERRLTDHIGLLTSLTDIDLSNNKIGNLPPSIGALVDLETLNVSKNVLGSLPQNFTFLTNLTDLDLSCNRFQEMPMVLCGMTTLRRLDLTSNIICQLPREVGALTTLTRLHLRHNPLKSLPLEIVDLEKHVQDLELLPNKWHIDFGPKEQTSRPAGCTSSQVFEWLRAQRSFHENACEAWSEKAALYLTGRASAREFVDDVRGRMEEDVWRPYLESHVLRFFFRAKRNGLPDAYHQVSQREDAERQHISATLAAARHNRARLCLVDAEARKEREISAYTNHIRSRVDIVENRRAQRSEHLAQLLSS